MALFKFLGEIDCLEDLADIIGQQKAEESFRGKMNYFIDLDSEDKKVIGVYGADFTSNFENKDAV